MAVNPIPDAYRGVTPYLIVKGGAAALDFYQRIFGGKEIMRLDGPEGTIGHAEIKIGESIVMLADPCPSGEHKDPTAFGGSPVSLLIYTQDVDAMVANAVKAGAEIIAPVENKFYGDRMGTIRDPFGHIWHISTHVEDVPPDEMQRRLEAMQTQS